MWTFLRDLFGRPKPLEEHEADELRLAFKDRYRHFKLLLYANNDALEIMAQIEDALRGSRSFGMDFVSGQCTKISTDVWQICRHLNELAPAKYEELYDRFKTIQGAITPILQERRLAAEGPLAIDLAQVTRAQAPQVGGKVANLGEMKNVVQLAVPNGFVVTAHAYQRFMEENGLEPEIDRRIQATNVERLDQRFALSASLQQLIINAEVPADVTGAITEHYRRLEETEGKGVEVAMRSSALGEDQPGASFAGQYRSILHVSAASIVEAYKEIVASKYSLPAISYRRSRGIRDRDVAMCVGVMRMVNPVSGGVGYSRNPVDMTARTMVINAAWGLPKCVVDGSVSPDLFVISRDDVAVIVQREIACKTLTYECRGKEGVARRALSPEQQCQASLTDAQALEVGRLLQQLEEHYDAPQDIEWALAEDGNLWLLQCRPLGLVTREPPAKLTVKPDRIIVQGGVTASPGAGSGPVFKVARGADALQFPVGGVLVAAQALPRWAPLLPRAAAVVTEHGSMASHLASVARELDIPAIFGAAGALDDLSQGALVTVDADNSRVLRGQVEALLHRGSKPPNRMEGSPVYEVLQRAAHHIVPLNLLDPDAPEFKSDNCRTLHDLTRFCHEKAVEEMFRFGKDHRFPERSSKQLRGEVAMQWWVLNLDDGFYEEVEGKYVQLDNIASIPMLALWEGVIAVPWAGPPAMDGGGFMSVMFEATRNPALTLGVRSRYADRNYFMVSKNYCSFTSRLGFHYSTVEALVSERPTENYVAFHFKGGAADYDRRLNRVLFVQAILETFGFRVDVKEDSLLARIENYGPDFMKSRLKLLGYLTIHTRQLDMIMANRALVRRYRAKIEKDLRKLVGDDVDTAG